MHLPNRLFSLIWSFIFFHVKENEPKENAASRLLLRVGAVAGARGNSPRFQRDSNRSARFDPAPSPMLSAGQGEAKPKIEKPLKMLAEKRLNLPRPRYG
jgi:hypothetical protein